MSPYDLLVAIQISNKYKYPGNVYHVCRVIVVYHVDNFLVCTGFYHYAVTFSLFYVEFHLQHGQNH